MAKQTQIQDNTDLQYMNTNTNKKDHISYTCCSSKNKKELRTLRNVTSFQFVYLKQRLLNNLITIIHIVGILFHLYIEWKCWIRFIHLSFLHLVRFLIKDIHGIVLSFMYCTFSLFGHFECDVIKNASVQTLCMW